MNETTALSSLDTRIRQALSLALQIPVENIPPDLAFGDLPQWDSMGHMEVMMRLEEFFGVEVTAETIASLTSISAIREYLQKKDKV